MKMAFFKKNLRNLRKVFWPELRVTEIPKSLRMLCLRGVGGAKRDSGGLFVKCTSSCVLTTATISVSL